MAMLAWIAAVVLAFFILGYFRAPLLGWTLAAGALVGWLSALFGIGETGNIVLAVGFVVISAILNIPLLRRTLLTNKILAVYRRILPDMSQTEKEAIDAGTVWW